MKERKTKRSVTLIGTVSLGALAPWTFGPTNALPPLPSLLQPAPAMAWTNGLPGDRALYLRGSFNAWRDVSPFTRLPQGVLEVAVTLPSGRHEFKVADSGWQSIFTVDPAESRWLLVGEPSNLVRSAGSGDNGVVEVRVPGSYIFRISDIPGRGPRIEVSFGGPAPRVALPFEPSAQREYLGFRAAVRVEEAGEGLRRYDLFSDAPQREQDTPARTSVSERPGDPRLRSGNPMFDALFGLAVREVAQSETQSIRDGAFNRGGGIPCDCFVTGEKWGYVWTRDTAYATDLGLGWIAPDRAWNSLAFKLSPLRYGSPAGAGGTEIVQDTGTGGSWPISTDRVTWALGADAAFDGMPLGDVRRDRLGRAYEGLRNTLERDRADIFDTRDGLYRGEQSFLDWREQSYPLWTRAYVTAIADGKALSTNVTHYASLRAAAVWAREVGDARAALRYDGWAETLKGSIRKHFYDASRVQLASLRLGAAYPLTLADRQDLLGLSLAVVEGIFDAEEARALLSRYPVTEAGSPVVWPQSAEVPVYHNRAIWPFVSAYAARAGAAARHAPFTALQIESVVRAAALHLSNMENLEFTTGLAEYFDGPFTGPVINSRRQLWSVAGFLSIVRDTLMGVRVEGDAVVFRPFVPASFARRYVSSSGRLAIESLPLRGKRVDVSLVLPGERSDSESSAYDEVVDILVDGTSRGRGALALSSLDDGARVEVILGRARAAGGNLREIRTANPFQPTAREREEQMSPYTPYLSATSEPGGLVRLRLDTRGARDTRWELYRNGRLLRGALDGAEYVDSDGAAMPGRRCYVAVLRHARTGLPSQPTGETCVYVGRGISQGERGFGVVEQVDRLENFNYAPERSAAFLLTLEYSNSFGLVSTGITAATRRVRITRDDGVDVASGVVAMPHLARWDTRAFSSGLVVKLEAGRSYRVLLEDSFNMSYLSHYVLFDGAGGREGPLNQANIHNVVLSPLENDL